MSLETCHICYLRSDADWVCLTHFCHPVLPEFSRTITTSICTFAASKLGFNYDACVTHATKSHTGLEKFEPFSGVPHRVFFKLPKNDFESNGSGRRLPTN